jgi:glutamate synthase domain-containing protein 1
MHYFEPDITALSNRAVSRGLYAPGYEHDACGVGLICSLKGEKSHTIVENGLQILVNLTHRGACGCDESTGDGAGILMQIPHRFLHKVGTEAGIRVPDENYMSSVPAIFAAGDARRGQSLVVWAISEGREAARCIDHFLSGRSELPSKGSGDLPRVP